MILPVSTEYKCTVCIVADEWRSASGALDLEVHYLGFTPKVISWLPLPCRSSSAVHCNWLQQHKQECCNTHQGLLWPLGALLWWIKTCAWHAGRRLFHPCWIWSSTHPMGKFHWCGIQPWCSRLCPRSTGCKSSHQPCWCCSHSLQQAGVTCLGLWQSHSLPHHQLSSDPLSSLELLLLPSL